MSLFYRARKYYNNPNRRYRVTPAAKVRQVAAALCIHRVMEATTHTKFHENRSFVTKVELKFKKVQISRQRGVLINLKKLKRIRELGYIFK